MAEGGADHLIGLLPVGVHRCGDSFAAHCGVHLGVEADVIGVAGGQSEQLRGGRTVAVVGGGEQLPGGVAVVGLVVVQFLGDDLQQRIDGGRAACRVELGGGPCDLAPRATGPTRQYRTRLPSGCALVRGMILLHPEDEISFTCRGLDSKLGDAAGQRFLGRRRYCG